MCRLTEGYYNAIREPGNYAVYRRSSTGCYIYIPFDTPKPSGKPLYIINVRPKLFSKYERGFDYGNTSQAYSYSQPMQRTS